MRFSIIVPIYNVEKYIRACIDSILAQTYKDYELILVNDGSKDHSREICEVYERVYNNIVLINKENGGPNSARKAGARVASGEYIICVDGDDYIHSDMLSKISEAIDSNLKTDIVCFGYYKDIKGKISRPVLNPLPAGEYHDMKSIREKYLYDSSRKEDNSGCLIYSICCKAIRKSVYLPSQIAIPNETKNGEDILLTAHALSRADNMTVLDYAGYYYRENPGSLTHIRSPRDLINVTNVKSEIEKIGVYPDINIAHYYINSIYILTCDLAKTSANYADFRNTLRSLLFDKTYSRKQAYNTGMNIRQKMKFILVQRQMWFVLFHFARKVRV